MKKETKKKIQAVTVCVNYSDFLSHTIANTKTIFDRLVVVTDTKDILTKNLCDFHSVECIQTDAFYVNGGFNKANGINEGLKVLDSDVWVVHIDADVYLTPISRKILDKLKLNKKCIYGIDRMNCKSFEKWNKFITSPTPTHEKGCFVKLDHFDVGNRLSHYDSECYLPIGFFQMWHPTASKIKIYPNDRNTVEHTDVQLSLNFAMQNRRFIPDINCIHLESEASYMGKNWNGRKTKWFGLDKVEFKSDKIKGEINSYENKKNK